MKGKSLVNLSMIAAALGLHKSSASRRAQREGWPVEVRGREALFDLRDRRIPGDVKDAVVDYLLRSGTTPVLPAPAPVQPVVNPTSKRGSPQLPSERAAPALPTAPGQLKDWQRRCMEARLALLAEVDRVATGAGGLMRARHTVAQAAAEGRLAPELQALVPAANQRGGKAGTRGLTAASLRRWDEARQKHGNLALAPRPTISERVLPPAWMPAFMEVWAQPGKRSVPDCMEELANEGVALPARRTIQLELAKLPAFVRNKGRMGPREIKKFRAFVRRDTSHMLPGEVFLADGHSFHAKVAHPIHGKPFRPEITTVIDAATRRACGWSVDLSENTWAVADALRHACEAATVPLIWYVDRGSGFNNEAMDDPLTGLLARLDITKSTSLPYNSQARGISERSHQSIWVRAARRQPTYLGKDSDAEAYKAVSKTIDRDLAERGASPLLPTWPEFARIAREEVAAYNSRPHSGLPKFVDPVSGKRRHMSPDEAWASAIEAGWEPEPVTGAEADDLFRPHVRRTVARGEVKLFSSSYFLEGLDAWDGEEVLVAFDLSDAAQVWVRTPEGQLIGVARFAGNAVSFFPKSMIEVTRERRTRGRLEKNDARRAEIQAEAGPGLIEHRPEAPLTAQQVADAEAAMARMEAHSREVAGRRAEAPPARAAGAGSSSGPAEVIGIGNRPVFRDDMTFVVWALRHPDQVVKADLAGLKAAMKSSTFRLRLQTHQQIDPQRVFALINKMEASGQ